jgi:hypothetical protein
VHVIRSADGGTVATTATRERDDVRHQVRQRQRATSLFTYRNDTTLGWHDASHVVGAYTASTVGGRGGFSI